LPSEIARIIAVLRSLNNTQKREHKIGDAR